MLISDNQWRTGLWAGFPSNPWLGVDRAILASIAEQLVAPRPFRTVLLFRSLNSRCSGCGWQTASRRATGRFTPTKGDLSVRCTLSDTPLTRHRCRRERPSSGSRLTVSSYWCQDRTLRACKPFEAMSSNWPFDDVTASRRGI
jgi:hypothetical protein